MNRITILLVGIAALSVISTITEAAQGCGERWYYDRVLHRCEPMRGQPGDPHRAKHYTCHDHHCHRTD